jgi:hypothetical protein
VAERLDRPAGVASRSLAPDPVHVLAVGREHGIGADRSVGPELRDHGAVDADALHVGGDGAVGDGLGDGRLRRVADGEPRADAARATDDALGGAPVAAVVGRVGHLVAGRRST